MKTETVLCNTCGADIAYTGATPRYRLVLTAEALAHTTNYIPAVFVTPPIDGPLYFCNLGCLQTWTRRMV